MEEKEFNTRIDTIKKVKEMSSEYEKNVRASINDNLVLSTNTLLDSISKRDSGFIEYLEMLKDFNYSDALTVPTDLFPGIRTISDSVNIEEINNKTQKMKDIALEIEENHKRVSSMSNTVIESLKRALQNITEYIIQENQIYDISIDLLQDLDSVYDISSIRKNTK